MSDFSVESRIWVGSDQGMLLGEGRIELLLLIDKHGSISTAAKTMGMSYKKAWRLVDDMNKNAPKPLVEQKIGGKGGGGTTLSDAGLNAIKVYQKLKDKHQKFLKKQEKWLNAEL